MPNFIRASRALALACALACHGAGAVPLHDDDPLRHAAELLDTYYGDGARLDEAAELIGQSLQRNPSAEGYAQAARAIVMGGHVVGYQFRLGTKETYRQLIDKALALDPRNVLGWILLSESKRLDNDLSGSCEAARKAIGLEADRSWAHVELAQCLLAMHDYAQADQELAIAQRGGHASTDRRGAYVEALVLRADLPEAHSHVGKVREYAALADTARDPRDAWTLGNLSHAFFDAADFDDAITWARRALQVSDYGAGHHMLAEALYGKAAQLALAKQDNAAVLAEARAEGVDPGEVLAAFCPQCSSQATGAFGPTVATLLSTR